MRDYAARYVRRSNVSRAGLIAMAVTFVPAMVSIEADSDAGLLLAPIYLAGFVAWVFPGRGRAWTDLVRTVQTAGEAEQRRRALLSATTRGPRPAPRLVRDPYETETVAAEWMRWMGYGDAKASPVGADEGIDVHASRAVAQVKAQMVKTARPEVQQLHGVATGVGKKALFFSLSGYTAEARDWADRIGMALFTFDLQGVPEPVNEPARDLFVG